MEEILDEYYTEKPMCILSLIRSFFGANSMKLASDVTAAVGQLIAYYEANAAAPGDASKRNDFIDAVIKVLENEKSKPAQ